MNKVIIIIFLFLMYSSESYAQFDNEFCIFDDGISSQVSKSVNQATTFYGDGIRLSAHGEVKVLIIFARFPNDNTGGISYWPAGQNPSILNSIIDSDASVNSSNQYNLTNFFTNMSLNKLDFIGDAISIEAPMTASQYGNDIGVATKDVIKYVSDNNLVDFSDYDNWSSSSTATHSNSPDGLVDHIYVVWRGANFKNPNSFGGCAALFAGGFCGFSETDPGTLNVNNGKTVKFNIGLNQGSGSTVFGYSDVRTLFNILTHEVGHWYLGGGHPYSGSGNTSDNRVPSLLYATHSRSMSVNASERDRLGWATSTLITGDAANVKLRDFIETGDALRYKLPNGVIDEHYYITNHQKVNIYDDATLDQQDKGIFVLHTRDANSNTTSIRYLLSDGDWTWENVPPYSISDPCCPTVPLFAKGQPDPNNGEGFMTKVQSTVYDSGWHWLHGFQDEGGNNTFHGYYRGHNVGIMKSSYNLSYGRILSSITNPKTKTWSGSETDFALIPINKINDDFYVDVYTNYDPYSITDDLIWDRGIFIEQDVTVSNSADLSILPGTSIYSEAIGTDIDVNSSAKIILNNQGALSTLVIEDGVTLNINTGAELELEDGSSFANRSEIRVKGILNINSGSTLDIGNYGLIIAEEGGQVNVNNGASILQGTSAEFNAGNLGTVSFIGNTTLSGSSSCLMTLPGGTMEFTGSLTVENGSFIQSHSSGGGTYIFNGDVTLKGSGNTDGYVMDLNDGTDVLVGYSDKIITYSGAKVRAIGSSSAERIKFTYDGTIGPDEGWEGIEMRGDGNIFEHIIVEGSAGIGLYFRSDNNVVEYANIRNNGSYGIYAYADYSGGWGSVKITDSKIEDNGNHGIYIRDSYAGLEYNDIKNNDADGIYIYNAILGNPNYTGAGYFRGNDIAGNNSNAIQLGYNGKVYDGYSTTQGNNNLSINSSHEVYLSSSNSRWYDATGGSYTAVLENTSSTSTKYVYNLAQTTSGESTISWTVGMENNAWDYAVPSSSKFYGSVDYSPYKTTQLFGSVGPRGTVASKLLLKQPDIDVERNVLSASQMEVQLNEIESDEEKDYYLLVREKLIKLKAQVQDSPTASDIPKKLNGLLGYYNELPFSHKEEFGQIKSMIQDFVSAAHKNGHSISYNERLASEAAVMLVAHQSLNERSPELALSQIGEYKGKFSNIDIKREIGFIEAEALKQLELYEEAIKVYKDLSKISKRGVDPKNTISNFEDEIGVLQQLIAEGTNSSIEEDKIKPIYGSDSADEVLPTEFKLNAAYPNPFNPSTVIGFELPESGKVRVDVFDISGRLVSVLTNQNYEAGAHSLTFNATGLASGIYIVRANIAGTLQSQRITLIK